MTIENPVRRNVTEPDYDLSQPLDIDYAGAFSDATPPTATSSSGSARSSRTRSCP